MEIIYVMLSTTFKIWCFHNTSFSKCLKTNMDLYNITGFEREYTYTNVIPRQWTEQILLGLLSTHTDTITKHTCTHREIQKTCIQTNTHGLCVYISNGYMCMCLHTCTNVGTFICMCEWGPIYNMALGLRSVDYFGHWL